MAGETKICDYCDQEIGKNETKCPKCNVDFEEAEESVTIVDRALSVIEKRKAKKKAEADAEAARNAPPPKKKNILFGRR